MEPYKLQGFVGGSIAACTLMHLGHELAIFLCTTEIVMALL